VEQNNYSSISPSVELSHEKTAEHPISRSPSSGF
jgi:hypothetical protein